MGTAKPYCILPWYHQTVRSYGNYPCCAWPSNAIPDDGRAFFNGQFMDDLRVAMLSGTRPAECADCAASDQVGNDSVRSLGWDMAAELGIDWTKPPQLRSLEINPSNVCNLKCRTCGSHSSTKWIADELALGLILEDGGRMMANGWRMDGKTATTIDKLAFLGGEPMLHQDTMIDALGMLRGIGRLGDVTLDVTTNCMVRPEDELVDLMRMAKRVYINLSIDAHGRLNDYIRSDSDWDTVQDLVDMYDGTLASLPNVWLSVTTVFSVLNANLMEPIWDWISGYRWQGRMHAINFCYSPRIYDARILPRAYRGGLIEHYRNIRQTQANPKVRGMIGDIIAHLDQDVADADRRLEWLRDMTRSLDNIRHQHLRQFNPELWDILHERGDEGN